MVRNGSPLRLQIYNISSNPKYFFKNYIDYSEFLAHDALAL